MENTKVSASNWFILAGLAVVWGSSFILIKRALFDANGVEVFTNIQVGCLRLLIASSVLLPVVVYKYKVLLGPKSKYLLMVGLLGNCIPAFLFATAQTKLASGIAGLLNSLVPVFTLVMAVVFYKVSFKVINIVGVLLGLVGACGLILAGSSANVGDVNWFYGFLIVLATICYAISTNVIKQYLGEVSGIQITALALSFVGIPAGIYLFAATDVVLRFQNNPETITSLGYLSLLAVMSTSLSLIFFNRLIRDTNAVFASSVTYLIPIVALFWGYLDGENLVWMDVFFCLIILSGIYLVNKKK